MYVGKAPPKAKVSEGALNQGGTSVGSVFAASIDDLPRKVPFQIALKVCGNVVSGATIGVLAGYALRADAGSTIGAMIGGAAGLVSACVQTVREWSGLRLDWITERRVRDCERLVQCAEADRIESLTAAADEIKAAAHDYWQAVMRRYASGKNVDVERGNQKATLLYRRALSLYRQALSLAGDESTRRDLTDRVNVLENLL